MSAERDRLVKLVRDDVGQFCRSDGVAYQPLTTEKHRASLRAKLLEEVGEYLLDPSLGELADVYEVVRALASVDLGVDVRDVMDEADAKRAERGGFDLGVGMFVRTVAPLRHDGSAVNGTPS